MDIYQNMIEQLWTENRSLLAMLGIASLPAPRRAALAGNLCRDGAHAIERLTDQNEILRQSVAQRYPGRDIDARLCA
jgi:hypothetical protein